MEGLKEAQIPTWINSCSLDEFKDALDFAPEGIKELIKNENNVMEKTQPRKKTQKLTQEEFIEKAISKHGDKFDYTPSIYVNYSTKVQVKCNKCGKIFEITPANLLSGYGCSHCWCQISG